jgi:hypothetical protein
MLKKLEVFKDFDYHSVCCDGDTIGVEEESNVIQIDLSDEQLFENNEIPVSKIQEIRGNIDSIKSDLEAMGFSVRIVW